MPLPIADSETTQSEPLTIRSPPHPIRAQTTSPLTSLDGTRTPPTAGPGTYDVTVIPPSHNARTIVLCFDGTGDQFDADVREYICSSYLPQ